MNIMSILNIVRINDKFDNWKSNINFIIINKMEHKLAVIVNLCHLQNPNR